MIKPPYTRVQQLQALIKAAQYRVTDAEAIPWPALAESWRRDIATHQAQLEHETRPKD